MSKKHITVAEAAQIKGVSASAVYRAMKEKRLDSTRILGKLALKRSDVEAWQPKGRQGRRSGTPMSEEGKARISAGQKKRWAARRANDTDQTISMKIKQ